MRKGAKQVTISRAIDEFCKYLLSKDTGRYIVKIIHFGSTAKGERSEGRKVYSVKKENLKKEACRNLSRLAEEYLDAARDSLNNRHPRLAVDAAYNAAELGVKAMLLLKLDDIPGSHGGVVGKFGELYVKSGEMSKTLGRRLNETLELRNSARYKYQALIGKKEASEAIDLAESIIELASKKFGNSG